MSASQNKKKTLSLGLALIPVISMLLLLIIGYGIMGLRIEPLLLCSAAVAAGIAWWQGYCWEDIINSVVDKLAKAMPVIMILICVGGLIGSWMFSGTIPYMVYWGLKLISPEYILIAAFFLTSVVSVCTGTSWGSAGTVGVALMGVAAGLDVSLAAAAGAVVSGAYFGDKISPLSDSTNFAAIVADTTLFEHIQHLLWTTLPSFLLAAVVFKDAYRRMGLDTKNLSRTIEDAGTVIEPLLPWTSAGVYMATTLGVSTLDLLPWAIQCYAAIFFALIYGFSGIGIARTASASEKSPQSSVTE
ncbi:TPA: hypothetical protein G8T48_000746 [Salmonella enterica]|nr:hypothetical protein [Salmonella enterica]HAG1357754.1 hypothetical protein [Salmonella enterica]